MSITLYFFLFSFFYFAFLYTDIFHHELLSCKYLLFYIEYNHLIVLVFRLLYLIESRQLLFSLSFLFIFFKISFQYSQLVAVVDDVYTDHSHIAGKFTMLSSSRVYVGGSVNPRALLGARVHNNFVGCLRKVSSLIQFIIYSMLMFFVCRRVLKMRCYIFFRLNFPLIHFD